MQTADDRDRIHVSTTYYSMAKHQESIGDIDGAIQSYEKSDTFRSEVPRMLFHLGLIERLEDYVHKSNDTALLKW